TQNNPNNDSVERQDVAIDRFKSDVWDKLTEIKVPHLHKQHCILVEYLIEIFSIQEQIKHRDPRKEDLSSILELLIKVNDFVQLHLREEEEFLDQISFPEVTNHKIAHKKFIARFDKIKALATNDPVSYISDLFLLIYSWLFEHINSQDTKYSEFYVQKPMAEDFPSDGYLLEAIMKSAIDGIVIFDKAGKILKFNTSAERMFEYNASEVIGRNLSTLMPSPYREQYDKNLEKYLTTGKVKMMDTISEIVGIKRSGTTLPLELSVSELRGSGAPYFIGIMHDITNRKRQEEEIIKSRDNLEQMVLERTSELAEKIKANEKANAELQLAAKVFDNAGEAILITEPDGTVISVNQAYLDITGFDYADIIGENPRIAQSGQHDKEFYSSMWHTLSTEGIWRGEIWDKKKSGQVYPKQLTITELRDQDGELKNYIGIFSDITNIKETEKKLEELAYYDTLTRLPNRKLFNIRLEHDIRTAERKEQLLALLFIDLDKFKHVNDSLGHAAGDKLLINVAERLTQCVRKTDTVSRLGGDEFTVILTDVEGEENIAHICEKIIKSLQTPFVLSGQQAFIGASIGISMFPQDGNDIAPLTKHADIAMYKAKHGGRGIYKFFSQKMNKSIQRVIKLESNLKKAIQEEQFKVFYQAKVDSVCEQVIGMEALVRWEHPERGIIPPNEFIPVAEESGLIDQIGLQVMKIACRDTVLLNEDGFGPLKVAINLSGRQFNKPDELIETISDTIKETNLSPENIELEITESMIMGDVEESLVVMKQIRELGISIALDDFGTGYSSLNYLKKFPIQTLKTDRSFIMDIPDSEEDVAIVSAIISLAKNLKMSVVAEGVETKRQLAFLEDLGAMTIQGYYYSRPLPFNEFRDFLKNWNL
ncbi:MAG: EAL domain-containing protein, partial [Magnetococcales bacterium]|nr:EAL domain-containing protein [Magnetococcales bacterium]